jgi:hypothetical protein
MDKGRQSEVERLPLSQATQLLLEECRMVLPGIQGLFGFQLMGALRGDLAGSARCLLLALARTAVATASRGPDARSGAAITGAHGEAGGQKAPKAISSNRMMSMTPRPPTGR